MLEPAPLACVGQPEFPFWLGPWPDPGWHSMSTDTQRIGTSEIRGGSCLNGSSWAPCIGILSGTKCFCLCVWRLGQLQNTSLGGQLQAWTWCCSMHCMGCVCCFTKTTCLKGYAFVLNNQWLSHVLGAGCEIVEMCPHLEEENTPTARHAWISHVRGLKIISIGIK
jgi:hypothetical protein